MDGEHPGLTDYRTTMRNHLVVLNQWQEMDQNGYLQSHVGNADNIFGVPPAAGGGGTSSANNDSGGQQHSNHDGSRGGRVGEE